MSINQLLSPRNPTDGDRVVVLGDTGSGKSQFAIGLLSTRDWHKKPWIIIDYKGEDLIEDILEECDGFIKHIKVTDKPPTKPGLYYLKVRPLLDDAAIELFLRRVYENQKTGIFLDEGYALPKGSQFFDIILTQGRSLKIPVICLYQRPVHMSRFAISQSTFRAVFRLGDERDAETAARFIRPAITNKGDKITVLSRLPDYHCLWYDVGKGVSTVLRPAPARQEIIDTFKKRLTRKHLRALI